MNKRKIVAVLTSMAVVTTLFVGCGTKKEAVKSTPKSTVIIGLSTDEGGLNDKAFNQSADEGVKKARDEDGFTYHALESQKKEDYAANLESLVEENSKLTFGIGYQIADAMTEVAKTHTDKNFAIVDSVVNLPNVASITFKEQEGSFLMGVIAGKMTKTNKIGFIGGKDNELINRFEVGFAAGVKAVNPEAAKGLLSTDGKSAGTTVKYADSFNDSAKGYELSKSLYQGGCDVIYHAAAGVGLGLFKAAKELKDGGKTVWAIGVDMDQSLTVPQYSDIILSSMIKRVDTATYNEAKAQVKNQFKGGTVTNLGLKEKGVGIADTSNKNVPKDVLDEVKKYEDKVIAGKIVVPVNRQGAKDFK